MSFGPSLKEGNVYTFNVPQNSANYLVRVAITAKGLWMCIEESHMQWKLTITEELSSQTTSKVANGEPISFKEFIAAMVSGLKKEGDKWSIGIMTAVELEMLRGGTPGSKHTNSNKLYLILSEKVKKFHYPFTFVLNDMFEKDKIVEAIKTMKEQLDELRTGNDRSQTSFSILSESVVVSEQLKIENEELKKKIKIYEESLTQKRGAVEIDNILREKNSLEIQAETKKREEAREITRFKNMHQLMDRLIGELKNEVDLINKELMLLEDNMGNPAKLKSHAMRVLKSYENDLRTSKKILMKQTKEVETIKRNLITSKNNERKQLAKIKQIEMEIEQAKKKANVKEISNRLYSPGNSRNGSSAGGSKKAPSVASDESGSKRSFNNKIDSNMVRQNLLKRTSDIKNDRGDRSLSNTGGIAARNQLLKTTPNIKSPSIPRKTEYKPPVRPVLSSHTNTNKPNQNTANRTHQSNDWNSAKSSSVESKKKEFSPADRERQKQMMERLSGAKKPATIPIQTSSSSKNIGRNSLTKPANSVTKKDTTKDILNKMKEVKAQYNNRSRNSVAKEQGIAAKVAQLTSQNYNYQK